MEHVLPLAICLRRVAIFLFIGEARRHLLNCSSPDDYNDAIEKLRGNLRKRGFPDVLMPPVPYDAAMRESMIRNLVERPNQAKPHRRASDLALKYCMVTPQLRHIGIRPAFNKLLRSLRQQLGEDFLRTDKFVIAHPSRRSLFLQYYAFNFPRTNEMQNARHRVRRGGSLLQGENHL
jgi:hypothetical protein